MREMREIILMRIEREIIEETLEILERITTLVILDINHDHDQDQILGLYKNKINF
jgi:hypothetical protein